MKIFRKWVPFQNNLLFYVTKFRIPLYVSMLLIGDQLLIDS